MNGFSTLLVLLLTVLVSYFVIKQNQCAENFSTLSGVSLYNHPVKRLGGPCGKTCYEEIPGYVLM